MYLVDYHTHTRCSFDSEAPLPDMAAAARAAGLRELCTTDHCDLQQEDGSLLKEWDWAPILAQYGQATARYEGTDFRLLLGLELGEAYIDPAFSERILAGAPLDFVIGSVHNQSPAAGGVDYYFLDYRSEDFCRRALDDYFACLLTLAPLPYYDTLAHIIYPLRYMKRRGRFEPSLAPWQDQLDQVLRTVIDTGRSVEVNTHNGEEVLQWRPILERYRELGGEYITLGSDAHKPENVAKGLPEAAELMKTCGFRYLTLYRGRRPEQIKLF